MRRPSARAKIEKFRLRDTRALIRYWGAVLLALAATKAYAEPSVSQAHIPVLWGIVLLAAAGAAATPYLIKKYAYPKLPTWSVWVLGVVAFLAVGFFGPIFVVAMSILITGRTM